MPHPNPDPALRRMVADLAALHAQDIAAVLDALNPVERKTIEGLLREHATYFDAGPAAVLPQPQEEQIDTARLSPWLAGRVTGADEAALTDDVRLVLRELTAALNATPLKPMKPQPAKRGFFRRSRSEAQ